MKCTDSKLQVNHDWLAEMQRYSSNSTWLYQFQIAFLARLAGCWFFSFFEFCLPSTCWPWPLSTLLPVLDHSFGIQKVQLRDNNELGAKIVQKWRGKWLGLHARFWYLLWSSWSHAVAMVSNAASIHYWTKWWTKQRALSSTYSGR